VTTNSFPFFIATLEMHNCTHISKAAVHAFYS
jgi:hypothetical protein